MTGKGHGRVKLPQAEGTLILQQSMSGSVMMIYRDEENKKLIVEQLSIEWEKGRPEIRKSKIKYDAHIASLIADAFNNMCAFICYKS